MTLDRGSQNSSVVFVIRRARDLPADRTFVLEYLPDDSSLTDAVFHADADRLRIVWERKSDTGDVLISDGVRAATGKPTPWLERCR